MSDTKSKFIEDDFKKEIIKYGQFPYKKRKYQYQSVDKENMPGIRDMGHRYKVLHLPKYFLNKRVLDIGCNMGMICTLSSDRKASLSVGIDFNKKIIDVAQRYLKFKEYKNIKLFAYNINDGLDKLISLIGTDKFDYVFALSIWKHVDKIKLYDIINYYCKEKCWFEGHSKQTQLFFEKELFENLKFLKISFLGNTTDRGVRPNFLLDNKI